MIRHIALHTTHGSLHGQLSLPEQPRALILIAHSHRIPEDAYTVSAFEEQGYAVLVIDLLTMHELQFVDATQNIPRLTQRLLDILDLIRNDGDVQELPLGIYANGDTAPAAVRCAAQRDVQVRALVCHGGLIDRAGLQSLELMQAPLLMIVDHDDVLTPTSFQRAASHIGGMHETATLNQGDNPLSLAVRWFARCFSR